MAPEALTASAETALAAAPFVAPLATGSFTIAGGVLRSPNLAIAGGGARLFGGGSLTLPDAHARCALCADADRGARSGGGGRRRFGRDRPLGERAAVGPRCALRRGAHRRRHEDPRQRGRTRPARTRARCRGPRPRQRRASPPKSRPPPTPPPPRQPPTPPPPGKPPTPPPPGGPRTPLPPGGPRRPAGRSNTPPRHPSPSSRYRPATRDFRAGGTERRSSPSPPPPQPSAGLRPRKRRRSLTAASVAGDPPPFTGEGDHAKRGGGGAPHAPPVGEVRTPRPLTPARAAHRAAPRRAGRRRGWALRGRGRSLRSAR